MKLNCPLPKLDFDTINLGHGSGGILTHQLLHQGVFSLLQNDKLNQKHDGAILELSGKVAFSTDSYVVNPIFFPGGDIGSMAVNGTVNDLAMCGAIPQFLSLSFIIEEGLSVQDFFNILHSIKSSADQAGIQIVTGDTKVVERNKGDKIFINTSGIGTLHPRANIGWSSIRESDVLIINGSIGAHGVAVMSQRAGFEFETSVLSDSCCLNTTVKKLLDAVGEDIHFMRDATRGGLASVLNEIAKDGHWGIDIVQKEIPVADEVASACEMLGLDPLYVANEGIFVLAVNEKVADDVLRILRADENGKQSFIFGNLTKQHMGQVVMKSTIGGKRVVNMLPGEQLPRIC